MHSLESKHRSEIAPRFLVISIMLLIALIALSTLTGCGEAPKIKVGVGETIITPPVGTPMAGYRRKGVSTGVHDDLFARSLVVEGEDGTGIVLMTLDLVNLNVRYMEEIKGVISHETGIPEANIIISCTHTHSGPSIGGASEDYRRQLVDNCVASAVDAWNSRVPGRIGTGDTVELELGKNDRRMHYGGLHPDPEVGIIKIEDAKGKLLGIAFNYGCHPSTLDLHNLEFTADWPYYSIKGIKEYVGEDVWVAYFQSAQGNVKVGYTAELSAVGADMGIRNFWYAEHKGNMMVWSVLEALPEIMTSGDITVSATNGNFDFPLRESYHMSTAEAKKADNAAKAKLAEMEKQFETLGVRVLDDYRVDVFVTELQLSTAKWVEKNPNPQPQNMQLQALRLGDAMFVTFPAEVYAEIGLRVKERSSMDKTYVIGLTSGHGGYMPTAEEYLEGGYSGVMTRYSAKCGDVLVDASMQLIAELETSGDQPASSIK